MENLNPEVDEEWRQMLANIEDADILQAVIFHLVNLGFGGELRDMIDELQASSNELFQEIMEVLPHPGSSAYYQYIQRGFSVPTGIGILQLTVTPLNTPCTQSECDEEITSCTNDVPVHDQPIETMADLLLKNNKLRETGLTIFRILITYKMKYEECKRTNDTRYFKLLSNNFEVRKKYNDQIGKLRKIIQQNSKLSQQNIDSHLKKIYDLELELKGKSKEVATTYINSVNKLIDYKDKLDEKNEDLNSLKIEMNQLKCNYNIEISCHNERVETVKKLLLSTQKLLSRKELEVDELNFIIEEINTRNRLVIVEQEICIDEQREEINKLKNTTEQLENIKLTDSHRKLEQMFNDCMEERFALEQKFIELKQEKEEESIGIRKLMTKARKQIRSLNKFIADCNKSYKNVSNFNDVKILFNEQEDKIRMLTLKIKELSGDAVEVNINNNLYNDLRDKEINRLKLLSDAEFKSHLDLKENALELCTGEKIKLDNKLLKTQQEITEYQQKNYEQNQTISEEKYKLLETEVAKINSQLQLSNADLFAKKLTIELLQNQLIKQKKITLKLYKQLSCSRLETVKNNRSVIKINFLKREVKTLRDKLLLDQICANCVKLNNENSRLNDVNQSLKSMRDALCEDLQLSQKVINDQITLIQNYSVECNKKKLVQNQNDVEVIKAADDKQWTNGDSDLVIDSTLAQGDSTDVVMTNE